MVFERKLPVPVNTSSELEKKKKKKSIKLFAVFNFVEQKRGSTKICITILGGMV